MENSISFNIKIKSRYRESSGFSEVVEAHKIKDEKDKRWLFEKRQDVIDKIEGVLDKLWQE